MRTTFDTAKDTRAAVDAAMAIEGYGRKSRSRWICEAITQLATRDPTFVAVGLGEGRVKLQAKLSLILTPEAQEVLKLAKIAIRREDPEAEGLAGQVIRAAIRTRLVRARTFGDRTSPSRDGST